MMMAGLIGDNLVYPARRDGMGWLTLRGGNVWPVSSGTAWGSALNLWFSALGRVGIALAPFEPTPIIDGDMLPAH